MKQPEQAMAESDDILARVRRRLVDTGAVVVIAAAVPALAAIVWRNRDLGWGPIAVAQTLAIVLLMVLALASPRLAPRPGVVALLAASYVVATFGLLRLGLAAASKPLLLLNCLLAMMMLGRRAGLFAAALGGGILAAVGALVCYGHVQPPPHLAQHLTQGTAWANDLVNYAAYAAIGLICLGVIHAALTQAIAEANRRADELEALNSSLRTANAELERYAYAVSHDLKSPLITIAGFVGRLRADLATGRDDRLDRTFERIESAAEHMHHLLDELLVRSRLGYREASLAPMAMNPLVEEALDLLAAEITTTGAAVVVAPGLPSVNADRAQVLQVVQNLVDNALKFARPGIAPRVTIVCEGCDARSGWPLFEVRDEGIGFAPAYATRLFDLFEQLDPSRPGAGVGLALVQQIIERHGGRVWAESAGSGQGARVFFTLPPSQVEDVGERP